MRDYEGSPFSFDCLSLSEDGKFLRYSKEEEVQKIKLDDLKNLYDKHKVRKAVKGAVTDIKIRWQITVHSRTKNSEDSKVLSDKEVVSILTSPEYNDHVFDIRDISYSDDERDLIKNNKEIKEANLEVQKRNLEVKRGFLDLSYLTYHGKTVGLRQVTSWDLAVIYEEYMDDPVNVGRVIGIDIGWEFTFIFEHGEPDKLNDSEIIDFITSVEHLENFHSSIRSKPPLVEVKSV